MTTSSDRRGHRRVRCSLRATAQSGNDLIDCRIDDISASGVALSTARPVEPDRFLRLQLCLGSDLWFDLDAVVVRSRARHMTHDWGARFVNLDPTTSARLGQGLLELERSSLPPPPAHPPRTPSPPPSGIHPRADPNVVSERELRALYRAALAEVSARKV